MPDREAGHMGAQRQVNGECPLLVVLNKARVVTNKPHNPGVEMYKRDGKASKACDDTTPAHADSRSDRVARISSCCMDLAANRCWYVACSSRISFTSCGGRGGTHTSRMGVG